MLAGHEDARRGDSTAPTPMGGGRKAKLTKEQLNEIYRPLDDETKSILRGLVNRFGYLPRVTAGEDVPLPSRSPTTNYVLSVDFEEALSDLASLMAGDEGPIMVQLGEMQVVTKHLAPMLGVVTRERWEGALFNLLNVLGLLTNPRAEANRASPTLLLGYCCQYKAAFEDENLLRALLTLAVGCVAPRPETASNDNEFLRKLLELIRNLLATPDQGLAGGRYERLVQAMVDCRLAEFLLLAAASVNDSRDGRVFGPQAHLLTEIMAHLLTASDPQLLAHAYEDFPEGNTLRTGPSDIERILQGEVARMGGSVRKPIRHSRFTGAFVVKLTVREGWDTGSMFLSF